MKKSQKNEEEAQASDGSQKKKTRLGRKTKHGKTADAELEEQQQQQQQPKKERETPSSNSRPCERTLQEPIQTIDREEQKATWGRLYPVWIISAEDGILC